jgi:hypothetical protein
MKSSRVVFAVGFVLCLLLITIGSSAMAIPMPPVGPTGVADGSWQSQSGTEIPQGLITTANSSWLQLFGNGLAVTTPEEICHPFRGGQFGWTGGIYRLNGSTWEKQDTVGKWVPDEEGEYMVCAKAPMAGTYALFGYFTQPPKVCGKYALSDLGVSMVDGGFVFTGSITPADEGIRVTYKFTNIVPIGAIIGAVTASTYTDEFGDFQFTEPFFINFAIIEDVNQHFYIDGCELDIATS